MYAKIPFAAGWTNTQIISVLKSLVEGTTNPASLPFGVVANASITNTIPHGWTFESFTSNILICSAPITGRNKRKYAKFAPTSGAVDFSVGDGFTGINVTLSNTTVARTSRTWYNTDITSSTPMQLHVSITPTRFITCIERLSNANPVTSLNQTHNVTGVVDSPVDDIHYTSGGKLLPVSVLMGAESSTTSAYNISMLYGFEAVRAQPNVIQNPKSQFVFAGQYFDVATVPNSGRLYGTSSASQNNVFAVGVANKAYDPVCGTLLDLKACISTIAPIAQEHTLNGAVHVAWSVGTANANTPTSLLVPKE